MGIEQQWSGANAIAVKILQVSAGFPYAYSDSAPVGSKVVAGSIALNGTPIDLAGTYRVTVNSFLATGGDNFLAFNLGTLRLGGAVDLDGLVASIEPSITGAAIAPPAPNRITKVPQADDYRAPASCSDLAKSPWRREGSRWVACAGGWVESRC